MNEIYKLGLSSLFVEIVLEVIKKFKIETKFAHLDATFRLRSMHRIISFTWGI